MVVMVFNGIVVVLLAALGTGLSQVTDLPPDFLDDVCGGLATTFNSINELLPISRTFEEGEILGIAYPRGDIFLDASARKLKNCVSYPITDTRTVIAHLELANSMAINFDNFEINGQPWSMAASVENSHFVLHYHISEVTDKSGKEMLQLDALMGEIKDLGKVTLHSNYTIYDGKDFTKEAEDLLRPRLLEGFNSFVKEELHWMVDPANKDTSGDGLTAFKMLFKGTILKIDEQFTSKANTVKP